MTNLLSEEFWPRLVFGLLINFQIAFSALTIGCIFGAISALICYYKIPFLTKSIEILLSIFRAMPVFITIFFVAGILRPYYKNFEMMVHDPKIFFMIIAVLPIIYSDVHDQVIEAIKKWNQGMKKTALFLIPNIARSFQNLVSASCFGAVIGVNEAISVILSEAELMGDSPWVLGLFLGAIVLFFGLMQIVVGPSRWLHRIAVRKFSDIANN